MTGPLCSNLLLLKMHFNNTCARCVDCVFVKCLWKRMLPTAGLSNVSVFLHASHCGCPQPAAWGDTFLNILFSLTPILKWHSCQCFVALFKKCNLIEIELLRCVQAPWSTCISLLLNFACVSSKRGWKKRFIFKSGPAQRHLQSKPRPTDEYLGWGD